jgi:hypothetical protein
MAGNQKDKYVLSFHKPDGTSITAVVWLNGEEYEYLFKLCGEGGRHSQIHAVQAGLLHRP